MVMVFCCFGCLCGREICPCCRAMDTYSLVFKLSSSLFFCVGFGIIVWC